MSSNPAPYQLPAPVLLASRKHHAYGIGLGSGISWNHDGSLLASASQDHSVIIMNSAGELIKKLDGKHAPWGYSHFCCFSPAPSEFLLCGDVDNTQILGRVNWRGDSGWNGSVQYWMTESDGVNIIDGTTLNNLQTIDQKYRDVEVSLGYDLPSGLSLGASFRDFDYDDGAIRQLSGQPVESIGDRIDYDGQIFTVRAGLKF